MFFVALLTISVTVARLNLITEGRREKEDEMIWRGRQYVRAIHLYYNKTHHFPMQLEDLYQPKTGIRFLRKPYSDPMNTPDGSWRLIYVGPSGQIIGSLNQQSPPLVPNAPPPNQLADPLAGPSFSPGDPLTPVSSGLGVPPSSASPNAVAQTNANNPMGTSGSQLTAQASNSSPAISTNAIIGVGSKINKNSVAQFEGQNNYMHFEFIWKIVTVDPATVTPNP